MKATFDVQASGRREGYILIPHSTNQSAYGSVALPAISLRNDPGPKVLLTAGNHGDEWEGQAALRELCRDLRVEEIRGQILILPSLNLPAAKAGRRTSPIDAGNLNRSFPGSPDGTVTERIAHLVETELLPGCDCFIDLHSGGASLDYLPGALAVLGPAGGRAERLMQLLDIFGAPISYLYDELLGGGATSTGAADRKGVLKIGSELGGRGGLSRHGAAIGRDGVLRLLSSLGSWTGAPPPRAQAPRRIRVGGPTYYVNAHSDGFFEALADLGEIVERGQPAARIHSIETPWEQPRLLHFQEAGLVICQRPIARVERGDCLFHLGIPLG